MSVSNKFWSAVNRLSNKINMSVTPVPGFIVGLSGTDSIIAFILLNRAMKEHGRSHRLTGIHYVKEHQNKPTWFQREIVPWLEDRFPETTVLVETPLGGNRDQQRWSDLFLRSTHSVHVNGFGDRIWTPYEEGQNYWVSGTINATEKTLGKYSLFQKSVSLQPIQTFWKSEILELCEYFSVPKIAMENSRIPDCLCGRDDIAAQNIELIDKILKYETISPVDSSIPPMTVAAVTDWIRMTKKANDWRNRSPYNI